MGKDRLSISRTALLAVHFCAKNVKQLLLYSLQAVSVSLAIALLIFWASNLGHSMVAIAIVMALASYAWCPLAIDIHRRIISGDPLSPNSYFQSLLLSRTARFYMYSVLFAAAFAAVLVLTSLAGILAEVLGFLVMATVFFRMVFAFPGIAVDQHRSLHDAIQLLSGSTWRLFLATQLVALPLVIVQQIVLHQLMGLPAIVVALLISAMLGWLITALVSYAYSFATKLSA